MNKNNLLNSKPNIIDINKIMLESSINNIKLILGSLLAVIGYYYKDVIFTKNIGNITYDLPKYLESITINKVIISLLPYIIALIVLYISNIISANTITKNKLYSINLIVNQLIDSIKSTKKPINTIELIIYIEKFYKSGSFLKIITDKIIPTIIVIFAVLYNITKSNVKFGIITAIIIILVILVTSKLEYELIKSAIIADNKRTKLYDELYDILVNVNNIIISDTKEQELNNIKKVKSSIEKVYTYNEVRTSNITLMMQMVTLFTIMCINYVSYKLYIDNKISSALMISNVIMTIMFMNYYNDCLGSIKNIINDIGEFNSIKKYFRNFKIGYDIQNSKEFKYINGDIMLKNVTLKYGNKIIFDNMSMNIKGGLNTRIIGKNGSGKTSIFKMLTGLINYNGNIYIDNQNLKNHSQKSINKYIAYIAYNPSLFNKTILYNIKYGTCLNDDDIIKFLNKHKINKFFNRFSKGLYKVINNNGDNISNGEKQFIILIRSFLQNKNIILMDEPTSSLDESGKKTLLKLIRNFKEKTFIIISNDSYVKSIIDINIKI